MLKIAIALRLIILGMLEPQATVPNLSWKPNDMSRPQPPTVAAAICRTGFTHVPAPGDAITLFDGRDLSEWIGSRDRPVRWKVEDGHIEIVPGTGSLRTRRSFGDCQLHLEFATPDPPSGSGQDRGNSGIKFMGLYEIQVLDSWQNLTYADGVAGAVYSEYPRLVNVSCPPGRWQTYDVVFHAPRFSADGKLLRAATVTVLYNGVLVQDNVTITGPTGVGRSGRPQYRAHAEHLPLFLQEHNGPVRFRNIWIRELTQPATPMDNEGAYK